MVETKSMNPFRSASKCLGLSFCVFLGACVENRKKDSVQLEAVSSLAGGAIVGFVVGFIGWFLPKIDEDSPRDRKRFVAISKLLLEGVMIGTAPLMAKLIMPNSSLNVQEALTDCAVGMGIVVASVLSIQCSYGCYIFLRSYCHQESNNTVISFRYVPSNSDGEFKSPPAVPAGSAANDNAADDLEAGRGPVPGGSQT